MYSKRFYKKNALEIILLQESIVTNFSIEKHNK